jgi:[ribosomal protein S5]-alanine N-acetyltransferase
MKIITETERLIIREILPTDVDQMFELHSDPEVHTFLGNKTITCKEQAIDIIKFVRQHYVDYGVGRWAIIMKETNEFVGWTGLEFVTTETNSHKNYYDLGYRLIKRYWGRGIATESAFASLDYAFNKLNATEVYGMAECENVGSNKVLKKVGLRFIETFDLERIKHNWYKVERTEYGSGKSPASR